jgi:nucleotide-binding universal stress UspA family protein
MSEPKLFNRILVATDGSTDARKATRVAVDLAKRWDAELIVLNVIPTPTALYAATDRTISPNRRAIEDYYRSAREEAARVTRHAVALAKEQGVKARGTFLDARRSTVDLITRFSRNQKVDLIVTGTRGLSGFKKLLLGSVSSGLVSHASCSVLVVR